MPSKLYKKGKLTKAAQTKLRNRLQKENQKAKSNPSRAQKKSRKATPLQAKPTNNATETQVKASETIDISKKPEPNARAVAPKPIRKAKELTLDDIEDTPPPQKLVKERQRAMNENNDVNWISLIGYNQMEAENEEKLYKKLERSSNTQFRRDLDEQTKIRQEQKQAETAKVNQYRNELNAQFKNYQAEDAQKEATNHKKMLALKQIRSQQVTELNRRRKYEELKLKKHDLRAVGKLKKALIKEKNDNRLKKE
eukprot:965342_1